MSFLFCLAHPQNIYNASNCSRRPLKDILPWFTEDKTIELVKDLQTFFDDGCLMGAITVDTGNGEKVLICVWKNEDEYYEDNPEAPRL